MTAVTERMGSLHPTPPSSRNRTRRRGRVGTIVGMLVIAALVLVTVQQGVSSAQEGGSTPGPGASPAASPAATPDLTADKLTVTFTEYNDSGIKGTATFYDEGDHTLVTVNVKNAGADHPVHIHAGTCNDLDPKAAYNLIDIHANGQSTTLIDARLSDLLASQYAIDLHLSPTDLGTMIACANITGDLTNAQGTPIAAQATPAAVTPTETSVGGDGTSGSTTPAPGMGDNTTTEITPTSEAIGGEVPTTAAAATDETPTEAAAAVTTAETPTPTPLVVANQSQTTTEPAGDGTGAGTTRSAANTSSALGTTGTGPVSFVVPNGPMQAAMLASASFALILFFSGLWVWRGERRTTFNRQSSRWSRLGM